MFVLLCSLMKKLAVFFWPSVMPLISTMFRSCAVLYPEQGTLYHERDTFDFSQGHMTKNQPMAVPVLVE